MSIQEARQLKFPPGLGKKHSIYHVGIYHINIPNNIPGHIKPPLTPSCIDNVCKVEAVRKSKRLAENYTTWLPANYLIDCEDAVREFHKMHLDQPKAAAFNSITQGVTLFTEVGLRFLMRTLLFPEFMISYTNHGFPVSGIHDFIFHNFLFPPISLNSLFFYYIPLRAYHRGAPPAGWRAYGSALPSSIIPIFCLMKVGSLLELPTGT